MAPCWFSRRLGLFLAAAVSASALAAAPRAEDGGSARARQVHASWLKTKQCSVTLLSRDLTDGLSIRQGRIAIFEFVRDIDYRISPWRPNHPEDILIAKHGDCRHKADLLAALLSDAGYKVRHVKVVFDFADLPIPKSILALRGVTKAFHDAVEVQLGDRWVYLDATWGAELGPLGFPITTSWDGLSPTRNITDGRVEIITGVDALDVGGLYDKYKVAWPVRSDNLRFVRALNVWLEEEVRQTRIS